MSPKLIPIVILVFYLASKIQAVQVVNFVVEEYLDLQQAPDLIFVNFGASPHYLFQ